MHPDLPDDDRLRAVLRQTSDAQPASPAGTELARQLTYRAIARQRKRRAAAIITSTLLVVGAATTAIALRPKPEVARVLAIDPEPVATTSPATSSLPTVSSAVGAAAATQSPVVIPPPPLTDRGSAAVAGSPAGILVQGGFEADERGDWEIPVGDGAFFDLATMQWRAVSPSPLSTGFAEAIALDEGFLVHAAQQLARYTPATDEWTLVDAPPEAMVDARHVLTTDDAVVVLPSGWLWRRSADTWTPTNPPSTVAPTSTATARGYEVFVVDQVGAEAMQVLDTRTGTWSPADRPPTGDGSLVSIGAADERLVLSRAVGSRTAEFDLVSRQWRALPEVPTFIGKCLNEVAELGRLAVVAMCGEVFAHASGDQRWLPITRRTGRNALLKLVIIDANRLVIDGRIYTADSNDGSLLTSTDPVRIAGVTIDASVQPSRPLWRGDVRLSIELTSLECELVATRDDDRTALTDEGGQQTLSSVTPRRAVKAPPTIEFWNRQTATRYQLSCPSTEAFEAAAAAMSVEGELVAPADVTATFAERYPPGFAIEPFDQIDDFLNDLGATMTPAMSTGTGSTWWMPPSAPNPGQFTATLTPTQPSNGIAGTVLEVAVGETTTGFEILRATRWTLCATGESFATPRTCRDAAPSDDPAVFQPPAPQPG